MKKLVRELSEAEAKATFSVLLEKVAEGETFTITRNGKPVAELRPLPPSSSKKAPKRKTGFWKGRLVVIAPDFDAPLPEFGVDLLRASMALKPDIRII